MTKQNTIDKFTTEFMIDYPLYTESFIRKSIDSIAYFVRNIEEDEQFVIHRYLYFLSEEFGFNIDTNIDSRN